jgi:hypothetical protein
LIDNLAFEAGLHGAKSVSASVEQDSELFGAFRRSGFCPCGWERFWRVNTLRPSALSKSSWEKPCTQDFLEFNKFRNKHIPPAVRAISILDKQRLPDYLYRSDHAIAAYADIRIFGNKAIIFPVMDESLQNPGGALLSMAEALPELVTTCYIAQTTGHGWLEKTLFEIAAPATDRKEQLIKYFTVMEKTPLGVLNHASESSHPDPVAPYVHSSKL